jgi:hypothetical protein
VRRNFKTQEFSAIKMNRGIVAKSKHDPLALVAKGQRELNFAGKVWIEWMARGLPVQVAASVLEANRCFAQQVQAGVHPD